MKRILTAILLAALLICLIACGSDGAKKYEFDVCGVKTAPGESAKPVTDGAQYAKSESSASCGGFDGLDYKLYYNGFYVCTTPAKDGDIISRIVITSDAVSTPEGITIGSTAEQVETAYGKCTQKSGENLRYESGDVALSFIIEGGTVTSVQYALK